MIRWGVLPAWPSQPVRWPLVRRSRLDEAHAKIGRLLTLIESERERSLTGARLAAAASDELAQAIAREAAVSKLLAGKNADWLQALKERNKVRSYVDQVNADRLALVEQTLRDAAELKRLREHLGAAPATPAPLPVRFDAIVPGTGVATILPALTPSLRAVPSPRPDRVRPVEGTRPVPAPRVRARAAAAGTGPTSTPTDRPTAAQPAAGDHNSLHCGECGHLRLTHQDYGFRCLARDCQCLQPANAITADNCA